MDDHPKAADVAKAATVKVPPAVEKQTPDFATQFWDVNVKTLDDKDLVTRTWLHGHQKGLATLFEYMASSGNMNTALMLFMINNKLQVIFRKHCDINCADHQSLYTNITASIQQEFNAIVECIVALNDNYPTKPESRIDMLYAHTKECLLEFKDMCNPKNKATFCIYAQHLSPTIQLQLCAGQFPAAAFSVYLLIKIRQVINIRKSDDVAVTHLLVMEHMAQIIGAFTKRPRACDSLIAEKKAFSMHSNLLKDRKSAPPAHSHANITSVASAFAKRDQSVIPDPENPAGQNVLSNCVVQ